MSARSVHGWPLFGILHDVLLSCRCVVLVDRTRLVGVVPGGVLRCRTHGPRTILSRTPRPDPWERTVCRVTRRRAVAERSVHEAAVEAVAGALDCSGGCDWCYHARRAVPRAIAALVASAEVREGAERAARRAFDGSTLAGVVDAILAALAGTEVAG